MKHVSTWIGVFLLFLGNTLAQNSWFIDFGQSMEAVYTSLEEKHYLSNIQVDSTLQRILVVIEDDKQVEYAFKEDKLFATSLSKFYMDKAQQKDREESCLNYLNLISNENVSKSSEGKKEVHTVVTSSRVIKFFVIPQGEGKVLQIAAFSRLYGDLEQDDQFFNELQVLEKKMVQ